MREIDLVYFQIKFPNKIESDGMIRKELIHKAKEQDFGVKLIDTKTIDTWLIEGLICGLFIGKKIVKNFDFKHNGGVKALCHFINKMIKTDYDLGDDKNVLFFKYFLQQPFENKARTMGIELKLDESNFLIKFSKNCLLYKEIQRALKNYEEEFIKISHNITTYDLPKCSELMQDEIF